jgi:dUTP pyrophosphatase
MQKVKVNVMFLDEEAKLYGLPKYRYSGDAGADLHVILPPDERIIGVTIFPGERKALPTGLSIQMQQGWWARITHRSSTEKRLRLRVIEGTIDNGYTGPLLVQVANENSFPIKVNHGDRLAQLILMPVVHGEFTEVQEHADTDRGSNGFGSTGHSTAVDPIGQLA